MDRALQAGSAASTGDEAAERERGQFGDALFQNDQVPPEFSR
jgi:hypothetical protein